MQGYIQSPNWPGLYPANVECTWRITPERGRRILVVIPEIFIAAEDRCQDSLVMRKSGRPPTMTLDCSEYTTPHRMILSDVECGLLRSMISCVSLSVCLLRGFMRLRCANTVERIQVLLGVDTFRNIIHSHIHVHTVITCAPAVLEAGIVFGGVCVWASVCTHKISRTNSQKLM